MGQLLRFKCEGTPNVTRAIVRFFSEMFSFCCETVSNSSIKKCTQAAEFNINVVWEKNLFQYYHSRWYCEETCRSSSSNSFVV